MKKRRVVAITLVALILLLFTMATLMYMRHEIVGRALTMSISKKTNNHITLEIDSVAYQVLSSTIILKNAVFHFDSLELNKQNTLQLEELRFGEFEMSHISILRLILYREIKARSLFINKPSSSIRSEKGEDTTSIRPEEIIEQINNNKHLFNELVINIEEININGGHFLLEKQELENKSTFHFDYGFKLHQFSSDKNLFSDSTRFLFSKKMLIKLENIRYIHPTGESISTDSINFTSGNTKLDIFGIQINASTKTDVNTDVSGSIRHIELDGISISTTTKSLNLKLNTINVREASLLIAQKDKDQQQDTMRGQSLEYLINTLHINHLDFINCDLLIRDKEHDTLLSADLKTLHLEHFAADSGFQTNQAKISFVDLNWITRELLYINSDRQLKVELQSADFNETKSTLFLKNISVSDRVSNDLKKTYLSMTSLELGGLSMNKLLNKQGTNLSLIANQPIFTYTEKQKEPVVNNQKTNIKMPENITLASVIINQGTLSWLQEDVFKIDAEGIDLNTGILNINDLDDLIAMNLSQIAIGTNSVNINLLKDASQVDWKNFRLNNSLTEFENLTFQLKNNEKVRVGKLQINELNLNALLSENKLHAGRIVCFSPSFTGTIDLRKNEQQKTKVKPAENNSLPMLTTKGLTIVNGQLNTTLFMENDTLLISTVIEARTNSFALRNEIDNKWLANLSWSLNLNHTEIHHRLGTSSAKNVLFDSRKRLFTINQLNFEDHDKPIGSLIINELQAELFSVDDLNYQQLILEKSLQFGTLTVKKPRIDIDILPSDHLVNDTVSNRKKIDINNLPFSFKEIIIQAMHLNLAKIDSSNSSYLGFNEMDINMSYPNATTKNLTDHLQLTIKDFSYTDQNKTHALSIHDIEFKPIGKHLNMNKIKGSHTQPAVAKDKQPSLLSYSLEGMEIAGLCISKTMPAEINIQKIHITNPEVDLKIPDYKNEKEPDKSKPESKIKLPKALGLLSIDTLLFSHLNYHHNIYSDSGTLKTELDDLDISVNDIRIDTSGLSADNLSFVESTTIQLGKNEIISSDSLYSTHIASIEYNFSGHVLTIDSLLLMPRYNDEEFFKKAIYQTDKTEVFGEKIVCNHIRMHEFIKTGIIHIGAIDIYGLNAHFYRDKRYPMNLTDFKKMPQQMMRDAKYKFLVDSVHTHNAEIHYKEIVEKAAEPGYIFLNHFNLSLYNLTNIPQQVAIDSVTKVTLDAKIMGQTDLQLILILNLNSPSDEFWFTGHTNSLNFSELNPVTQNLVGINMEKGQGSVLMPMIKGDSSHTTGSVVFLYKKLRVGLYNREKARSTSGLARGMANILLNDLIIKSNNPVFLKKPKTGIVYFDRVTEKSFVFYIWKSILSGMLSTFGINSRDQRQEKREMNAQPQ